MDDQREYDDYIKNANKSSQVPIIEYDASTGKRKDDLDLSPKEIGGWCLFVGVILALAFITHLSLDKGLL